MNSSGTTLALFRPLSTALRIAAALCGASCLLPSAFPADMESGGEERPWADFVEPDFPFYSSIVDARDAGPLSTRNNIAPRGLILSVGHGIRVCFDTDLLRVCAAWTGEGVTPVAMATISYHHWDSKADVGEAPGVLPKPVGKVWAANGIYPGWQIGTKAVQADPRTPAPSPEEVGRGPLPPEMGRFEGLKLTRGGVRLEYTVGAAAVRERMSSSGEGRKPVLIRWLSVGPSDQPLILVLSRQAADPASPDRLAASVAGSGAAQLIDEGGLLCVTVAPHRETVNFRVGLARGGEAPDIAGASLPADVDAPAPALWPQELTTRGELSKKRETYVVDNIEIPLDNPWRRNVRPGDIQFFPDGTGATVTIDGDVWLIHGLGGDLSEVRWKRFASGLQEPLSLAIRGGEIYVFDRNGIWRLRDTTGRGEADSYEMFSNVFAQSADTREYASAIKLAPDGAFILAKGGLAATYIGKLNGTVIRVAPDGRSYSVLGWGFREPFIGVNPRTGLVTASDQEGRYVPATPLYIVKGDKYHGFLSPFQPKEKYPAPIADPLTWIPHTVAPSGITQVWVTDARMGPLDGSLIMLSYNIGELFRVTFDRRGKVPQAAVTSITRDFRFNPLSAGEDPQDGQLYVAGFRIIGGASDHVGGLARVRYTGLPSVLPVEVAPMDRGVLLRFEVPLNPIEAANVANYTVERWDYRRRYTYGSLQYKHDGSVGHDAMGVASASLSKDGKSVFLGVPDMKTGVMQMHVGWSLSAQDGEPVKSDAYFTPYDLTRFQPEAEGFGDIPINLHIVARPEQPDGPAAEGAKLYQALGCMACHSLDGTRRVGPSWKGLYGQTVTFSDGVREVVNDAYIRAHLKAHPTRIVPGYDPGMPNYDGIVTDVQVSALIAYIKSVR